MDAKHPNEPHQITAQHTPEPWEFREMPMSAATGLVTPESFGFREAMQDFYYFHGSRHSSDFLADVFLKKDLHSLANAYLIKRAPTAPHECDDPQCPGNVNRLKLEAFPELLSMCKNLTNFAESAADCVSGAMAHQNDWSPSHAAIARELATEARTIIAKAEPAA